MQNWFSHLSLLVPPTPHPFSLLHSAKDKMSALTTGVCRLYINFRSLLLGPLELDAVEYMDEGAGDRPAAPEVEVVGVVRERSSLEALGVDVVESGRELGRVRNERVSCSRTPHKAKARAG